MQGNVNQDRCSPFCLARNLHRPIQLFDALTHAGQAEAVRTAHCLRHEPLPIVLDESFDGLGQSNDRDKSLAAVHCSFS